jgi:hypothetical protein
MWQTTCPPLLDGHWVMRLRRIRLLPMSLSWKASSSLDMADPPDLMIPAPPAPRLCLPHCPSHTRCSARQAHPLKAQGGGAGHATPGGLSRHHLLRFTTNKATSVPTRMILDRRVREQGCGIRRRWEGRYGACCQWWEGASSRCPARALLPKPCRHTFLKGRRDSSREPR